jgi:hypothetical protein
MPCETIRFSRAFNFDARSPASSTFPHRNAGVQMYDGGGWYSIRIFLSINVPFEESYASAGGGEAKRELKC